jgi:hypothetical protein
MLISHGFKLPLFVSEAVRGTWQREQDDGEYDHEAVTKLALNSN